VTFQATEAASRHFEVATLNAYRFPVKQGISHFLACRVQQSRKSAPGDAHLLGAFFMLQAFQVFKADCLGFLNQEVYLLKLRKPYSGGLEIGNRGYGANLSPKLASSSSSHQFTSVYEHRCINNYLCTYAHNSRYNYFQGLSSCSQEYAAHGAPEVVCGYSSFYGRETRSDWFCIIKY
jgi:hypothetical protein